MKRAAWPLLVLAWLGVVALFVRLTRPHAPAPDRAHHVFDNCAQLGELKSCPTWSTGRPPARPQWRRPTREN